MGGLDPSVDKDVLEKLFSRVPNMLSIEMDMDNENHFRVGLVRCLDFREQQW